MARRTHVLHHTWSLDSSSTRFGTIRPRNKSITNVRFSFRAPYPRDVFTLFAFRFSLFAFRFSLFAFRFSAFALLFSRHPNPARRWFAQINLLHRRAQRHRHRLVVLALQHPHPRARQDSQPRHKIQKLSFFFVDAQHFVRMASGRIRQFHRAVFFSQL